MIYIPSGPFKFGINPSDKILSFISDRTTSLNAQPIQNISLKALYIDRLEVSFQDFIKFKPSWNYVKTGSYEPIRGITWYEAEAYCLWVNKRLPTEQEWEKAARGKKGFLFAWGNKFNIESANFGRKVLPSGSFPTDKSPYGVMDMTGNVSEWVSDTYKGYPGSKYKDQNYEKKYKVIRGGSFYKRKHGFMKEFVMLTHRNFAPPNMRTLDTGFRCARSIT
tara:strand:+ start:791 stop:1453 length:663 start_codon:yes stop_codon:yes gene_type:complete